MKDQKYIFSRRDFLKAGLITSTALTVPSFLTAGPQSRRALKGSNAADAPITIIIQLGGGNDGLNTVVPYNNDIYYKSRPRLAQKKSSLLKISDELGLHESCTDLKRLFDDGDLALVNNVGYPNPNRSHFRSMEIWQTASDSENYETKGWIGKYFDAQCSGCPDPHAAVNIGTERPQAFAGKEGIGVSFNDPSRFRWLGEQLGSSEQEFRAIHEASSPASNSNLAFLNRTSLNALESSQVIRKVKSSTRGVEYPQNQLARSLKTISSLIASDLNTRIYYSSISGFDTHAQQSGLHRNLLQQFSSSLLAFVQDLKSLKVYDRTTILCFSEFGRRVEENKSGGTDHGTAGPVFMAGGMVQPGIYGKSPNLKDLEEGDLAHETDFRQLYGEILDHCLKEPHENILGRSFNKVGVIS